MEQSQSRQQMELEHLDVHMQKNESRHLTPITEINSEWIIELNIKQNYQNPG